MEDTKTRVKMTLWVLTGFGLAVFVIGRLVLGKDLPKMVPLWYSRPWGESQLASPNSLIMVPSLIIITAIITHLITEKTKSEQRWLQIARWSGTIVIAILTLALLRIWILAL